MLNYWWLLLNQVLAWCCFGYGGELMLLVDGAFTCHTLSYVHGNSQGISYVLFPALILSVSPSPHPKC